MPEERRLIIENKNKGDMIFVFRKFTKNLSVEYINYKKIKLYKKGKLIIMTQNKYDIKKGYIWVSYETIWSFVEKRFNGDFSKTQNFLKKMIEKDLKLKDLKPLFFKSSDVNSISK
jgi:hypothetical protein